jgi:hypothetical protein
VRKHEHFEARCSHEPLIHNSFTVRHSDQPFTVRYFFGGGCRFPSSPLACKGCDFIVMITIIIIIEVNVLRFISFCNVLIMIRTLWTGVNILGACVEVVVEYEYFMWNVLYFLFAHEVVLIYFFYWW